MSVTGTGTGRLHPGRPARPERRTILFALPDLVEPYFAELATLVLSRAEESDVSVVIYQTWGEHERELNAINGVGVPQTDGLLHVPRSLRVADLTRRALPGPLVLLGEHIESSPFAHVSIDNHAAAAAATRHLMRRGCHRIAMIGPREPDSDASNRRYAGYRTALAEKGVELEPALVGWLRFFTLTEGRATMLRMLDAGTRFDGLVCSNDSVALGAISALTSRGLRVPDDVRVVGMDDITMAAHAVPPLTTVGPDKEVMVSRAISLLVRQMNTPASLDLPVEQINIAFNLIERDSTR